VQVAVLSMLASELVIKASKEDGKDNGGDEDFEDYGFDDEEDEDIEDEEEGKEGGGFDDFLDEGKEGGFNQDNELEGEKLDEAVLIKAFSFHMH
jgi:hypothetical protein